MNRAQNLQKNAADAEKRLWQALRNRKLANARFHRRHTLGRFVVDFVCLDHRLVVELEGGQHAGSAEDRSRDAWLSGKGYHVLRFWNNEVLTSEQEVITRIKESLKSLGT